MVGCEYGRYIKMGEGTGGTRDALTRGNKDYSQDYLRTTPGSSCVQDTDGPDVAHFYFALLIVVELDKCDSIFALLIFFLTLDSFLASLFMRGQ